GLGSIDINEVSSVDASVEHLHAEVCVVGGGPAGLAAAAIAAEAGADVLLLEREARLGGHLLYEGDGTTPAETPPRFRVMTETTAFGLYEGNLLGAFRGDRLLKVRAHQVIVATGGRQRPFVFANNDLPGVMLGRGARRLARMHGVVPGKRAV